MCCTTHYIRQYNTSGSIVRTLTLLDTDGLTKIPHKMMVKTKDTANYGAAIEIREKDLAGVLTGDWREGPRIDFHWGNRVLRSFGVLANGNFHRNGDKIWDAANDGAGSGLDADLLDGLHGSSYLTVSGYASTLDSRYVNVTGDTMTGTLNVNAYIQTNAWFEAKTGNTGLYNSNKNARWFAQDGGLLGNNKTWTSDQSIQAAYAVMGRVFLSNSSKTITVTGDKDTYYPVQIKAIDNWNNLPMRICVSKKLGSTSNPGWAGNHSNGTSSLVLCWEGRQCGWDGNGNYTRLISYIQPYAALVGDFVNSNGPRQGWVIWLRGGTATYEIYSNYEVLIDVYYSRTDVGISAYPQYLEPLALANKKTNREINLKINSNTVTYSTNLNSEEYSVCGGSGTTKNSIYFYYNKNDVENWTSVLRESASGRLAIQGKLAVGAAGVNDSYALSATSFYSSGNLTTSSNITASGYIQSTSRIISGYDNNAYWISTKSLIVQNQSVHNGGISTTSVSSSSRSTFSGGITAQYSNTTYSISCDTIIANHENVSNYLFERRTYPGSSWNSGYGAYNIELMNNGSQTPLCVAYRSGKNAAATGTDRVFAIEILNSNGNVHFCIGGVERFEFNPSGQLTAQGNIISKGEVTAYSTSDMRLKKDICEVRCDEASYILSKVRPVKYKWNEKAFELNSSQRYKGEEYGIIAQELQPIVPCAIKTVFEEYLSIDYTRLIPPIIAVVNEHELEIQRLKTEVEELKSRLEVLNCMR